MERRLRHCFSGCEEKYLGRYLLKTQGNVEMLMSKFNDFYKDLYGRRPTTAHMPGISVQAGPYIAGGGGGGGEEKGQLLPR